MTSSAADVLPIRSRTRRFATDLAITFTLDVDGEGFRTWPIAVDDVPKVAFGGSASLGKRFSLVRLESVPVILELHDSDYHRKVIKVNHHPGISPDGDSCRIISGMDRQPLRRKNLRRYIAKHYLNPKKPEKGNVSAFARAVGKKQSQIADTLDSRKPFREVLARDLESRAGMPDGWLDHEDLPIPPLKGGGPPKLPLKPADTDIADVAAWVIALDEVGRRRFDRLIRGKPASSAQKNPRKPTHITGAGGA